MKTFKLSKSETFSFSGYRPHKFGFPLCGNEKYEELVKLNLDVIIKTIELGYTNALVGGAPGFDILSAELIMIAKRTVLREITLICVLPYNNFNYSKYFDDYWRPKYDAMIEGCDHVINITGKSHEMKGCYQLRNKYMVDNSSRLICYHTGKKGGTDNTIKYAESRGIEVVNIANLL